jgi:UDP-N-acetylglucosamine--N-acetylmuramyl-(pentapeptide) pyrophosphoryl-undecaprenol N-acetylglucosamine transferase
VRNIKRIIITGGGTGGHLIPSFAIANALKEKIDDVEIRFIGSKYGIESKLYKDRTERSYLIKSKGLIRGLNPKSILQNLFIFPVACLISVFKVIGIYKKFKPDIVVGTGGYSSAIPLFVARIKRIRIIIQEQNAIPGLVNKLFLSRAHKVCFGFKPKQKSDNFVNTGNPILLSKVQENEKCPNNDSLVEGKFTLFIIGGSQGSVPINNHFIENYQKYIDMGVNIIWQCGEKNISNIRKIVCNDKIYLHGFIKPDEMANFYSKANLVISRSGALTLSELANFNVPSILIPFPHSANNHQVHNAKYFYSNKSAEIVLQNELSQGVLEHKFKNIISNKKILDSMKTEIKKIAKPDAAKVIVNNILGIC